MGYNLCGMRAGKDDCGKDETRGSGRKIRTRLKVRGYMARPILLAVDDDVSVLEAVVQDCAAVRATYRIMRAASGRRPWIRWRR